MFNKFELVGAGVSVCFMAFALYLVQMQTTLFKPAHVAQPVQTQVGAVVVASASEDMNQARTDAYLAAIDEDGNFNRMVIDDIKVGAGEAVKAGDTVAVHYVGTLQNGEEFDNSRKRGTPFEFKVGAGMVITGWDEGVVGMKTGGQRVLVIPPEMAYGDQGIGPIPGGATLVFAIELVEIK